MNKDVWVCVGTNSDGQAPTWFYVFRSPEHAEEFVDRAYNEKGAEDISWEIYPCVIEPVKSAMENFRMCLDSGVE